VTAVALTLIIDVTATSPNFTEDVPAKFVPVIVTDVPPATEPFDGNTPVIIGGRCVMNDMIEPVVVPPAFDATIRK
jgi:hypothetical protein